MDSPRIQSDISDPESLDSSNQGSPKEVLTDSQKAELRRQQYYGRFSLHNDPDAMIGLIALRKGLTNDFTAAAENSGPADFFQNTGSQQVLIE